MKPIRWTIIATAIPAGGSLGGIVRYTTEMIRALGQRDDVVVSVVATKAAGDTVAEMVGDRARVSTIPNVGTPLLSIIERLAPLPSSRGGADVIQGVKHLLPRRTNALRVLTIHDMLLLDRPHDFGLSKRLLLPAPYRGSINDADLLLCVSEATRARVSALVPGSSARAEVVRLATSSSLLSAEPKAIPTLAGRRFALVVGDASPRKNLKTLLAAWPQVRTAFPDVVLAVVGPPNWATNDDAALFEHAITQGDVLALGYVSDAELRWAYENAMVALAPSLAEGFGLPAAEALDLGTPVVISDDAALVEISASRASAVVPAANVGQWSDAIIEALQKCPPARADRTQVPPGDPFTGRTWANVAEDSVAVVKETLARRATLNGRR